MEVVTKWSCYHAGRRRTSEDRATQPLIWKAEFRNIFLHPVHISNLFSWSRLGQSVNGGTPCFLPFVGEAQQYTVSQPSFTLKLIFSPDIQQHITSAIYHVISSPNQNAPLQTMTYHANSLLFLFSQPFQKTYHIARSNISPHIHSHKLAFQTLCK